MLSETMRPVFCSPLPGFPVSKSKRNLSPSFGKDRALPRVLGPKLHHRTAAAHQQAESNRPRVEDAAGSMSAFFTPALAAAASAFILCGPLPAEALKIPPQPLENSATRCMISTLDKFAETRAKFSLEASSGAMDEALVDIRGCDFHGIDLSAKVFSGVLMDNANLEGTRLVGVEMSRAIARNANLAGVDLTDANAYSTVFDGSDLRGAQFENAILSSASFGKGLDGQWANLEDAHFEGALLSSSDVARVCQNPTLSLDVRKYELGCK